MATIVGFETTEHVYRPTATDERGGQRPLKLLLHLPLRQPRNHGRRRLPILCWIHGSGFFGGDHLLASPPGFTCAEVALQDGYAIAQIDHRGSRGGGVFPGALHDVKAAVRWLRRRAATPEGARLDPNRVGVWGTSSGGYFSAMLAVTSGLGDAQLDGADSEEEDEEEGQGGATGSDVCCAVDYFGPTDFLQMDAHSERDKGHELVHDGPDSPEGCFMGFPIQDNPGAVQLANPITYVLDNGVRNGPRRRRELPPLFMAHGDEDKLVPCHQSWLLAAALQSARHQNYNFHVVKGGGHGDGFEKDRALAERVKEFLLLHLKCEPLDQSHEGGGLQNQKRRGGAAL